MKTSRSFFIPTLTSAGLLAVAIAAWPGVSQAQRPAKRAARSTAAAPPAATPSVAPAPSELAKPTPADADTEQIPPTDDEPSKDGTTETDIDASQAASFSSKDRIAIFLGNVKVTDPRFQLVCDKLTVFLNKPTPAGQNAAATPAPTATPAPAAGNGGKGGADGATPSGGSGIDHVLAEGHVVILQKKAPTKPGEEEKISIGRGETGTFDNKSGDMVLRGWPSLEQNGSSLIAKAETTVMTIHRDSSLNTDGPCSTHLIQHGKGEGLALPIGPETPTGGRKAGGNNPPNAARPATNPPPAATTQPAAH